MALRGRGFMSVGAAVACCALAAACTSEPTPTSAPSPSPAATTPTESQIERQIRLDYEAAEEAYRVNMAEQDRLYQAGGSEKATLRSKPPPGSTCESTPVSGDVQAGWHAGRTKIVGVSRDGAGPGRVG